jgi:hypothetical protein
MSRWFRFYADAMRNPKVLRLSDKDFRLWVRLLAVASENDGHIAPAEDLKMVLAMRLDHLKGGLDRLIRGGLIDLLADGYEPHGWGKYQYKSDISTARVHKHRAKRNVSETPPDTDTDTDVSVAKATAADAPLDPVKVMFDSGVALITAAGKAEGSARAWLAKARQNYGAEAVIVAIGCAKREGAIDPIPFMEASLRARARTRAEPVVGI